MKHDAVREALYIKEYKKLLFVPSLTHSLPFDVISGSQKWRLSRDTWVLREEQCWLLGKRLCGSLLLRAIPVNSKEKNRECCSVPKNKRIRHVFCCPCRFGVVWLARINETIFRAKCTITRNDMQQKLASLLDMCLLFHLYLNPISTFLLSCIATRLTHVG